MCIMPRMHIYVGIGMYDVHVCVQSMYWEIQVRIVYSILASVCIAF